MMMMYEVLEREEPYALIVGCSRLIMCEQVLSPSTGFQLLLFLKYKAGSHQQKYYKLSYSADNELSLCCVHQSCVAEDNCVQCSIVYLWLTRCRNSQRMCDQAQCVCVDATRLHALIHRMCVHLVTTSKAHFANRLLQHQNVIFFRSKILYNGKTDKSGLQLLHVHRWSAIHMHWNNMP